MLQGGFGSAVMEYNTLHGNPLLLYPIAVEDRFISQGDHQSLLKETHLDDQGLYSRIREVLDNGGQADER